MMTLAERLESLEALGHYLRQEEDEYLAALQQRTAFHNPWFTLPHQQQALSAICKHFLDASALADWVAPYTQQIEAKPSEGYPLKTVGLVLAGNIPLVGFHDILCVFVAGHRSQIKLSEKDKFVLPYLIKVLCRLAPKAADYFDFVEQLKGFDAVIATGSNNSARYFEAYFGKYPNIIRRNRNGVAILTGQESSKELRALGGDIFQYFGLGCRNVAKLYVPEGYDFRALLEVLHEWKELQNHPKYRNNFDYHYALLTLNKTPFYHNGAIILREDTAMLSHIAGLYYEYYSDLQLLEKALHNRREEIQLLLCQEPVVAIPSKPFGEAQQPKLNDYADGVDTMAFLLEL